MRGKGPVYGARGVYAAVVGDVLSTAGSPPDIFLVMSKAFLLVLVVFVLIISISHFVDLQ